MLFRSIALQEELQKNGFVIIPLLNEDELGQLNAAYNEVHNGAEPPEFIDNIHMTTWCMDRGYKQAVAQKLNDVFKAPSDRFFQKYRRLNNVFIVKRSGQQSSFKVHQDWNVVDEHKYESVNVWVPLHDVDLHSGALWVLKGSHNIARKISGGGYLFPDYGPYFDQLEQQAISIKLKAGEAIVFYHSVIHGSPPNLAPDPRKAACFSVIPQNAPLCIYFQPAANDELRKYEPADDFIYNYRQLRSESLTTPPAENAVEVLPSYNNKKVQISELSPFFKTKKSFFSLFRK